MNWLRLWISPTHRAAVMMQAVEEDAAIRLACVAGAERHQELAIEVDRRTAQFAQRWMERADRHTITPRTAALRSVTDDVAKGWL